MWALLLHLIVVGLFVGLPSGWLTARLNPHILYTVVLVLTNQNKTRTTTKISKKKSLYNNSKINNRAKNNKNGKRNRIVKEKKNMRRLKKRKMIMRVEKEEKQ